MKLTAEVIAHAEAGPDALKENQLFLRGFKAPAVENLGAAPDVYDTLNLTDNDIRALTNFPELKRLRTLYVANNQIVRMDPRLAHQLPYLTTLVLTNNNLSHLAATAHALAKFPFLEYVSLLNNPISAQQHYRSYLIWRCPKIRVLDFQRVTDAEREVAKSLLETSDGRPSTLAAQIGSVAAPAPATAEGGALTFEPGQAPGAPQRVLTVAEKQALAQAIENASSIEQIRALEEMIRLGHPLPEAPAAPAPAPAPEATSKSEHPPTEAEAPPAQEDEDQPAPKRARTSRTKAAPRQTKSRSSTKE